MRHEVECEPSALNAAARFLKDDPAGPRDLLEAIDGLADDPRPGSSAPFGDYRRLRVGPYRALCAIEDAAVRVLVLHLGRAG
ncbi:mRNA interferase RelE/StbE [Streptomyces zhaozhouensis]|uniref:mRNA interferase RelE/StbE n=1 Tax=Streptomyces zhaozhouensis TaxID=1300267 RepID=A0A286DYR7_9ACTN|nr:type II toxin-antitoxin system RelE/ParE family toxin [Streptomyces zhaozhouensis]SOD63802.1 mRNA interferase RelE/StbE [Streptomyces zhaozhouensis]